MRLWNRLLAFTLIVCILSLCCACGNTTVFLDAGTLESHLEKVSRMEQTGDSTYISGIRTGNPRTGMTMGNHIFECTDDGSYFLALAPVQYMLEGKLMEGNDFFLFFAPHNSDQVIKLCGRPDCTHNTKDCNANFEEAVGGVTYYDGHLYIPVSQWEDAQLFDLYRVDPDGTNRVKVGSFADRSQYSGWTSVVIIDGVFTYVLKRIDNVTGKEVFERFYYALDGSMEEPLMAENRFSHINQDLMDVKSRQDGDKVRHMIYSVDIRNDEWTLVFDAMDYGQGYWGKEAGYVLKDHAVVKVHYEDSREEVLFETGLEGEYYPRFFPDCIVLTQTADAEGNVPEIPMVYFYSWEGDFLGELPIDFDYTVPSVMAIMGGGETRDRIYLWTKMSSLGLPTYYIEKSDFGTGDIELHVCQYPDLNEEDSRKVFSAE